ncbi:aminoglycoside phosphotransferase family protein [Prauserella rugosa]|uniref:Aminoglycoside/hydroxyurea antibiotic resistance kinase n=1 Tax=Prauserella rugosa TaxID=43354 RepID=A0A660CFK9_9PSEU|nr:aminoglycoside phosphotransferase family protein [Prauserella rugosa]TWH20637.1 aminoglycoside/hydroxyurea antibiotic resistance kinase [Prauserella rugosa]
MTDVVDALRLRWRRYWPDADVQAMADDVRTRAEAAIAAWGLRDATPLTGGHIALVLASGDVVLKVHPRGHPDDVHLAAEAAALTAWRRSGAAADLLDIRDDGFTLLLERLRPGTPLDAVDLTWQQRLDVLGELAGRLHAASGPAPASVPHIGGGYSRDWRRLLGPSPLLEPADDDVVLHADLHGANAVRHGSRWRVIDPHAVRGDRHADVWALIDPLAPAPPEAATARAWVERYAAAANLDPDRAAEWVHLRARAEALAGADGDHAWATRLKRWAELLES